MDISESVNPKRRVVLRFGKRGESGNTVLLPNRTRNERVTHAFVTSTRYWEPYPCYSAFGWDLTDLYQLKIQSRRVSATAMFNPINHFADCGEA
jgi:hypothetical protein